ncbi:uncharacterized protein LOC113229279 isoform X2 [Hyposmocoma kahamanoa]|uniref:uncharacterized protein LOC113229279 isoform X2 n=1 Tax=Hyposmocoma kahamanoa TaxID=1477025 RepID=UPI000E6D62F0|nr:uncharacterized protein LOC113229279 isoform X2 [Hyposmocoma kahamanoa]
MTNREDDGESFDPRVAALLAVHLVGQVLDEAYVIAVAAHESGQPWDYLSMLKNRQNEELGATAHDEISMITSKGDHEALDNCADHNSNVATSTPQKILAEESIKPKLETSIYMGQGDGEFEVLEDLSNSTSLFINHLFDMSEVEPRSYRKGKEQEDICDDMAVVQNDFARNELLTDNELLTEDISKIMESYVNTAFNIALGQEFQICEAQESQDPEKSLKSSEQTGYSFLTEAFSGDLGKDVAFYVENECVANEGKVVEIIENMIEKEAPKFTEVTDSANDVQEKEDVTRYENAYLTLNRDYEQEQGTDDEADALFQDPKALAMQDVELANNTLDSVDNLSVHGELVQEENKELMATSAVSAVSRKSKSSLVSRCRTTGARLLSCLRGWWRRKTPGRRKDSRGAGSIRGICPLSPEARRRAASLLDQRHLYSPGAPRSVVWKFNTVNEAMVNSAKWKEYTFEMTPDPSEKLALEDYY